MDKETNDGDKSRMSESDPKMKLGGGGRFAALKAKLASKPGVTDPGALAAAIGRAKYGAKKFAALGAAGREHKHK